MTDFKVTSTVLAVEKNQAIVHGEIANGTVKAGMKVKVSLDQSPPVATEISGVSMNFKGGKFEVGVILQFKSGDDLSAWQGLNVVPGGVLRLEES